MNGLPEDRALLLGQYIVEHQTTVRQTAKAFGVSKSTVHNDVSFRLKQLNDILYRQVEEVLQKNKQERHIRGGLATQTKYKNLKSHEIESSKK